jgi:hypothetical protein
MDFFLSLFFSPYVFASSSLLPWKSYLVGVMGTALIGGIYFSYRNKKADTYLTKIILAGLYFWLITFSELILLAFIYHLTR